MSAATTLGADLRALRKARGLTLEDMAEAVGRSVGWMSQVERGISKPDAATLQKIARLLDVPMSLFFGTPDSPEAERGKVVRAQDRRTIGERNGGLIEALLSPDLTDDFEVVHSTFMPGARLPEAVTRPTQELAYIVTGQLDIWIDGQFFTVFEGDSFRVRGQPMRWANPYAKPAVAIWVIAPPVY